MTVDRSADEADLAERYRLIVESFLDEDREEALFRASELARECLKKDLGPHRLTDLHLQTVESVAADRSSMDAPVLRGALDALLLEVMVVYGEAHREVQQLLNNLRASQDELRRRTDELIQAEKLAALGELSASVVHEINQPLNAVMLICKDVSRDHQRNRLDLDTLEESLDSIVGEVRRVSQIVDQLRVFSRNTAGTRRERIEVRGIVAKALRFLGQQLAVAGIDLDRGDFPEDGELPGSDASELFVYGDATQLQQVLINLTTNARDALQGNPSDRPKRLRLEGHLESRGEPPRSWVVIEVADTGEGIPAEHLERIFEPFYTSKGPTKGTGLGLSVTRRIVEEHGGFMEVDSELDRGTTFRMVLPFCEEGSVY